MSKMPLWWHEGNVKNAKAHAKEEAVKKENPERDIFAAALVKYGPTAQFAVALEELAELSKELAKCLRENPEDPGAASRRPQVAEEIADVKNMLAQVEYIMGLEAAVEDQRVHKLQRLASRIAFGQAVKK